MRSLGSSGDSAPPGAALTVYVAPPPNSNLYLRVRALGLSSGRFTLSLHAMKASDAQEPNDEPAEATRLTLGRPVEANIMDARDVDCYSFVAPRSGKISVHAQNRSATLLPAVTVYGPQFRSLGPAPNVHTPGDDLRATFEVQEGQPYTVAVASKGNSSGEYTLTVTSPMWYGVAEWTSGPSSATNPMSLSTASSTSSSP
jgi:hypothetical protein